MILSLRSMTLLEEKRGGLNNVNMRLLNNAVKLAVILPRVNGEERRKILEEDLRRMVRSMTDEEVNELNRRVA